MANQSNEQSMLLSKLAVLEQNQRLMLEHLRALTATVSGLLQHPQMAKEAVTMAAVPADTPAASARGFGDADLFTYPTSGGYPLTDNAPTVSSQPSPPLSANPYSSSAAPTTTSVSLDPPSYYSSNTPSPSALEVVGHSANLNTVPPSRSSATLHGRPLPHHFKSSKDRYHVFAHCMDRVFLSKGVSTLFPKDIRDSINAMEHDGKKDKDTSSASGCTWWFSQVETDEYLARLEREGFVGFIEPAREWVFRK